VFKVTLQVVPGYLTDFIIDSYITIVDKDVKYIEQLLHIILLNVQGGPKK